MFRSKPHRSVHVTVYTRPGCHLCDDAKALLDKYKLRYQLVIDEFNVDKDPVELERFGDCVPVVAFEGKVRFRGRVNEILLKRLLKAMNNDV